jgi:hypothetical protein
MGDWGYPSRTAASCPSPRRLTTTSAAADSPRDMGLFRLCLVIIAEAVETDPGDRQPRILHGRRPGARCPHTDHQIRRHGAHSAECPGSARRRVASHTRETEPIARRRSRLAGNRCRQQRTQIAPSDPRLLVRASSSVSSFFASRGAVDRPRTNQTPCANVNTSNILLTSARARGGWVARSG